MDYRWQHPRATSHLRVAEQMKSRATTCLPKAQLRQQERRGDAETEGATKGVAIGVTDADAAGITKVVTIIAPRAGTNLQCMARLLPEPIDINISHRDHFIAGWSTHSNRDICVR